MKKFLTVLLVIAVMFTFSFSSAMAKVEDYDSTLAKTHFDKAIADAKDGVEISLTAENAEVGKYFIDYDTIKAKKDEIWTEVERAERYGDVAAYVGNGGGNSLDNFLNATTKDDSDEGNAFKYDITMDLVKAQFEADKQEALDILNSLSTAEFSDKEMSSDIKTSIKGNNGDAYYTDTCRTYAEHVKHLISDAIKNVKDSDKNVNEDSIESYESAYETIYGSGVKALKIEKVGDSEDYDTDDESLVIEKFYEGSGEEKVGLGTYELNDDFVLWGSEKNTNSGEENYLETFKTAWVDGNDATTNAEIAKVKANIAVAYANYIRTSNADLDYAKNAKAILDYLADQEVTLETSSGQGIDLDAVFSTTEDAATAKSAIEEIESFEAKANSYATEKDSTGALVRDAEDVADLVTGAKIYTYASVYGINEDNWQKIDNWKDAGEALAAIANLYISLDSEELAYEKKVRETRVEEFLADAKENGTYYEKEYREIEAILAEYLNKVNAVTDLKDVDRYDKDYLGVETAGDLKEIAVGSGNNGYVGDYKTKAEVKKYVQDATTLDASAVSYADLVNQAITKSGSKFYLGNGGALISGNKSEQDYAKLYDALADMVGATDARTKASIEALSGQIVAMVQTLPTVDTVADAEDAYKDAIDALPTTAKIGDKALIDAAIKAVDDYEALSAADAEKDGLETAVMQYAYAFRNEMDAKAKAVSTTDKAANDTIVDEIDAFIDAYEDYADEGGVEKVFKDNGGVYQTSDLKKLTTNLDNIKSTAKTAVKNAVNSIPVTANLTEKDKATVENARKLYDAYVAEYTDYTDYAVTEGTCRNGFAAGQLASEFATLAKAEASLGMNYSPIENAKAYVQDLKIKARSAKTSKGIKVTVSADVQSLLNDGFTVEYKFYRSTKSNAKYGTAKIVKTENTYLNTAGTKGTKYYYKAKLVVKDKNGTVVATTPLTQCLYACRTF